MEKWKTNLRDMLNTNGYRSYKSLNEKLYRFCNEWINTLNEFDSVKAVCTFSTNYERNTVDIKVTLKESRIPFKASLIYENNKDNRLSLTIKSATKFDFISSITYDHEDCYSWEIDSESNIEILEQGYCLELLSNRLGTYIYWVHNKDSI